MCHFCFACSSRILITLSVPDAPTPVIYTLSLHDALPIYSGKTSATPSARCAKIPVSPQSQFSLWPWALAPMRSEEHTSELQSHLNLVCRLLLEKKKRDT